MTYLQQLTNRALLRAGGIFGLIKDVPVPGHLSAAEGTVLRILARRATGRGAIVEIGAFKGRSTFYIASGLKPSVTSFYTIDTWNNDAMPGTVHDCFPEFESNIAPVRDRVTPIRESSKSVAQAWSKPIELLFLDADHSYTSAKSDLESWLPFVMPRGWVCCHDYTRPTCGVKQAVDESLVPRCRYTNVIGSMFVGRLA